MNLRSQKELASRALGVSKKRVKFDISTPENKKALKEVISREGVKELLGDGIIKKVPKKGISRTRANKTLAQKKKVEWRDTVTEKVLLMLDLMINQNG